MLRFAPVNPYPATFYEEYKPILYPKITYGTAGNIWAEMLCRFGLAGVALFGVGLILLGLALADQVVAAGHGADGFLRLTLDVLDDAPDGFLGTAVLLRHGFLLVGG